MKKKKKSKEKDKPKAKPLIEDIYPHEFWLEKYNNLQKFNYTVYDKFLPHINVRPVTQKFHSKADNSLFPSLTDVASNNNNNSNYESSIGVNQNLTKMAPTNYRNYLSLIEKSYQNKSTNQLESTSTKPTLMTTTNTIYGSKPIDSRFVYDQRDLMRFHRPIRHGVLSIYADKLTMQKITQRPSFNGLVFKLY